MLSTNGSIRLVDLFITLLALKKRTAAAVLLRGSDQ